MTNPPPLPDTGERMIPERTDGVCYLQHVNRYRFAAKYAPGKRTLDIACGEGYGSAALLRAGATSVIGIDIDEAVVEHARIKYGIDSRLGDAERIPLPDGTVDLVTSFETIEHVRNPKEFLRETSRVLSDDGILVISTPNKKHVGHGEEQNPFHLSELEDVEFIEAIEACFRNVSYFCQVPLTVPFGSPLRWASLHTSPRCRILSGSLFRMRPKLCSEYGRELTEKHRNDPIGSIVDGRGPSFFDRRLDPNIVRPWRKNRIEEVLFLIAVASK